MTLREINFDGIVGPSHNYAGLSLGNLASERNLGKVSYPRQAALQGIEKMRTCVRLGLVQGILPPHSRPHKAWIESLGTIVANAPPEVLAAGMSASAMWTANAATVSPSPDTNDGRCHLTIANLNTMAHRSHEWPETLAQLRLAFSDDRHFAVGLPVTPTFGDEGAANHMRLAPSHDAPGVEVFVYGLSGSRFPARQHLEACRAIARRHRLNPDRTLFVQQSRQAIDAGAFHNDVVAVANERVLLVHEQAYEDQAGFYDSLRRLLPEVEIIEVPAARVSLEEAVASYLFNAQLVSLPAGGMALILPKEAEESVPVRTWLQELVAGNGPIRQTLFVDLRQSMSNGGGPACLRLRVVADPATIDPRFLVDEARLDEIARCVDAHWPTMIAPEDLGQSHLQDRIRAARAALLKLLELTALPL